MYLLLLSGTRALESFSGLGEIWRHAARRVCEYGEHVLHELHLAVHAQGNCSVHIRVMAWNSLCTYLLVSNTAKRERGRGAGLHRLMCQR